MDTTINDVNEMLVALHDWSEQGQIRAIDYAFAKFLYDSCAQQQPSASSLLLAAMASYQPSIGNLCFSLANIGRYFSADNILPTNQQLPVSQQYSINQFFELLNKQQLLDNLKKDQLIVTIVSSASSCAEISTIQTPLILQDDYLYLQRFWHYEQQVFLAINMLMQNPIVGDDASNEMIANTLAQLFETNGSATQSNNIDWQKLACALAYRYKFCVITGGPGTGKTTTVVKLLALLQKIQLHNQDKPLKIALAAPTGKAAARLAESITYSLQCQQQLFSKLKVLELLPQQCTTIHRLLGYKQSSFGFTHDANNQLNLDLLVVDEASMLDLRLLYAIVQALPPHCRLILLGDKDQLASVDAGAILSQLCQKVDDNSYNQDTVVWLQRLLAQPLTELRVTNGVNRLQEAVIKLQYSHRFNPNSGLGQLAQAINQKNIQQAKAIWQANYPDLQRYELSLQQDQQFRQLLLGQLAEQTTIEGYSHYLAVLQQQRPQLSQSNTEPWQQQLADWAKLVLQAWQSFQTLCCIHDGFYGVTNLNQLIEGYLRQAGLLTGIVQAKFYEGRPVMMSKNDYVLRIMNGDVGITLAVPVESATATGETQMQSRLMVAFADPQTKHGIRWLTPRLLTEVQTVFAMTVHKSQGSEFTNVALVLPNKISPTLTKELIYTAITRAKKNFALIQAPDNQQVEQHMLQTSVNRQGGIDFFSNGY